MSHAALLSRLTLTLLLIVGNTHAAWSAVETQEPNGQPKNESGLTLKNGKPWPTDATMRKSMETIQRDLQEVLPRIRTGSMTRRQYNTLAKKIHTQTNLMARQCKLPPEADTQFHLVLSEVIKGAVDLQTPAAQASGAARIVHALDLYGRHFDHADWKPLSH